MAWSLGHEFPFLSEVVELASHPPHHPWPWPWPPGAALARPGLGHRTPGTTGLEWWEAWTGTRATNTATNFTFSLRWTGGGESGVNPRVVGTPLCLGHPVLVDL